MGAEGRFAENIATGAVLIHLGTEGRSGLVPPQGWEMEPKPLLKTDLLRAGLSANAFFLSHLPPAIALWVLGKKNKNSP